LVKTYFSDLRKQAIFNKINLLLEKHHSSLQKIDNSVARRLRLSMTKFGLVRAATGPALSDQEPKAIDYNVAGLLERFFLVRNHEETVKANGGNVFIRWDVPGDVSEDYQKQLSAYVSTKEGFEPVHENNHMTMCEAYTILLLDANGFLARRLAQISLEA
jgi:DNA polymerase III gamma/tau subunit